MQRNKKAAPDGQNQGREKKPLQSRQSKDTCSPHYTNPARNSQNTISAFDVALKAYEREQRIQLERIYDYEPRLCVFGIPSSVPFFRGEF